MQADPDDEDMEEVRLDDEIYHHWKMVLNNNNGGVDYEKDILHDQRWDV